MDPTDLDAYTPSPEQLSQVEALCDLLKQCYDKHLAVSLVGGYGLDALYGRLTRDHHDFDFLVARDSRDNFAELITSLGYTAILERFEQSRRKEAYFHPITGMMVEFIALDMQMLIPMAERYHFPAQLSLFLPETFNGRLLSLPIRVPTIEAMEIIDRIQTGTAAEENWGTYKQGEHNTRLLAALKNRNHS